MPIKDLARFIRDEVLPRERLRRRFPRAHVGFRVVYYGDPSRTLLGDHVALHGPSIVSVTDGGGLTGARLEIGPNTYVGEFNNIRCAGAPIVIGADCLISQFVTIVGSNHGIAPGRLIVDQPWHGDGVVLGDGVWVGAGSTLLPGARIGDGTVIAANSVVRGEIPPGSIVGGSPAQPLGTRG